MTKRAAGEMATRRSGGGSPRKKGRRGEGRWRWMNGRGEAKGERAYDKGSLNGPYRSGDGGGGITTLVQKSNHRRPYLGS